MARLFHINVGDLIASATRRLKRARVYFGHGTDNAHDEAAALLLHVMKLPADASVKVTRRVSAAQRERFEALLKRRIEDRVPLPYLTNESWFAGYPFYVDERVLIPRSAIAELIERQFTPWIDPSRVKNVLDMGTGSGCIALMNRAPHNNAAVLFINWFLNREAQTTWSKVLNLQSRRLDVPLGSHSPVFED